MVPFKNPMSLEKEVEKADTQYGFTWVSTGDKYRISTPDNQFKDVPKVVIDFLRVKSSDTPISELIAETAEEDSGAANVLQEMHERGFIREGAPVKRVRPPNDIRLWHRALGVALVLCFTGVLWVDALSTLVISLRETPFQYLLMTVPPAIPIILCSVVVHESGHYYTAWKQGLDPSFGISVINGVVPVMVTRTHDGWYLPRNRRMWNTLAGPTYGLVWTLGVFVLYYTVVPYPALALAGVICFNIHLISIIPLYHGDGYLLMTDFLDQQNLRTRGLEDLRNRHITWSAAYAALSYGLVIIDFAVSLVIGYLVGDLLGAGIILVITIAIYAESRLGIINRLRAVFLPIDS